MEVQAQIIFKKVIGYLAKHDEITNLEAYLHQLAERVYNLHNSDINEWETASRRIKFGHTAHLHTLGFAKHRITVSYNYLYDITSYATVMINLIKDFPKPDLSIRKVLFLYDFKSKRLVQLDNEISKPD